MLVELTIRQFAIIEELRVSFKHGLNILTGETGAGKSIIIDAIQLIIGGRGSVEFIRIHEDKAEIEALFDITLEHPVWDTLQSLGIATSEDGMLLLKRDLLQSGKSVCRVNGQLVTLAMLKEVGQWLIQLHSQHQHQHLLLQEKQLILLDAYGEKTLEQIKKNFQLKYQQYDSLRKDAKSLIRNEQEIAQRLDLLTYQIDEISKVELQAGEEEELQLKRNKVKHAEKITTGLNNAYQMLSEEHGVVDLLSEIMTILEQVSSYDTDLTNLYEQLTTAFYQIEDMTSQMNNYVQQLEFEPQQLNLIEERLFLIHHLKRKYGESVETILEYAASIENELHMIQNRDEHMGVLQKELKKITEELIIQAKILSDSRQVLAKQLSQTIEQELKDLQMQNTRFKVDITYQEAIDGIEINEKKYHITSSGLDKVQFLLSPNPGEPLKALNKIASGGELSRIMLAIQTILAHQDDIPTIIFDEIDTGVSGRAAQAIAEKLAIVSKDKQVFVITHLPQVASMADHHYLIEKKVRNHVTSTEINYLDLNKRVDEISRMLSGKEVTELTKEHAKEMIENALLYKDK